MAGAQKSRLDLFGASLTPPPLRAITPVFKDYADRCELVADSIRPGEFTRLARLDAGLDKCPDFRVRRTFGTDGALQKCLRII